MSCGAACALDEPNCSDTLAKQFRGARKDTVKEILEVLAIGGRIEATSDGRYFRAACSALRAMG